MRLARIAAVLLGGVGVKVIALAAPDPVAMRADWDRICMMCVRVGLTWRRRYTRLIWDVGVGRSAC